MENKKEKLFRYGDKVYHHKFGWGEVNNSTNKIVEVKFKNGLEELKGDDLELLSFSVYSVELNGFTQDPPERTITWHSIWEDFCDEGYIGQHYFANYLHERYKIPENLK